MFKRVRKTFRLYCCTFGLHLRGLQTKTGMMCEDCDFYKAKVPVLPSLNLGGDW